MRRISDDERRARLGRRHRLTPTTRAAAGPDGVVDVARSLVAFHATDPASVYLSAWDRTAGGGTPADVSHALYDDRTLLRMLGMRRTMFVVPTPFAPVVQAAATDAIAEREVRRLVKLLGDVGIADGERWLAETRAATLAALEARGEALAVELSADVPALRTRFTYAEGKAYGNEVTLTSQVMTGLGASGHIVRGRPRGTWAASQYRWAPAASWLAGARPSTEANGTPGGTVAPVAPTEAGGTSGGAVSPVASTEADGAPGGAVSGGSAGASGASGGAVSSGGSAGGGEASGGGVSWGGSARASGALGCGVASGGSGGGGGVAAGGIVGVVGKGEAQVELVGAWLRAFGPGTEADVKWWTGFGLGEVRTALATLGAVEVELEGGEVGLVLPDDVDDVDDEADEAEAEPWVALLPALDPTAMGWAGRGWYLGEHRERLFDRTGNIGPTVWVDGRIVGGWGQYRSKRKGDPADGEIRVRLLQDVGAEHTEQVHAEAERLRRWVGDVRFTPRFRTPLERDLVR
jgi:hypothetical protein